MTDHKCGQCGATAAGMICEFCGSLTAAVETVEAERAALEEYHHFLQSQPRKNLIRMIRSGYLPQQKEALLDAGVRCMALIVDEDVNDEPSLSARERLSAIVTWLKLLPIDQQVSVAIREFEERIARHRRYDLIMTLFGLVILGLIAWGVIWCISLL